MDGIATGSPATARSAGPRLGAFALAAALFCLAAPVHAQGSGVSVLHLNDLGLGFVIGGMTATVQPTDANAGRYSVHSLPNRSVRIQFSLPSLLQTAGGTLPVSFGPVSAAWSTTNNATTATRFNPLEGVTVTMPPSRTIYIWLGARVAPPPAQVSGLYTGTVTLTASYN
jgi:hypothetical protein